MYSIIEMIDPLPDLDISAEPSIKTIQDIYFEKVMLF